MATDKRVGVLAKKITRLTPLPKRGSFSGYKQAEAVVLAQALIDSGVMDRIGTHGDGDGYEVGEFSEVEAHNAAVKEWTE